ncbi:MAG: hypothetical protein PHI85_04015 [Victivallaceae bacterium]|nr:hypothetical protein [Victivallaceae bacterium]
MAVDKKDIERQAAVAQTARDGQSAGADFAQEYEIVDGVKFFRPTMSHAWFATRWGATTFARPSLTDAGVVLVASLLHEADYVRNELMPLIAEPDKLILASYRALEAAGAGPGTADKVVLGVGRELFSRAVAGGAGGGGEANPPPPAAKRVSSRSGGRG